MKTLIKKQLIVIVITLIITLCLHSQTTINTSPWLLPSRDEVRSQVRTLDIQGGTGSSGDWYLKGGMGINTYFNSVKSPQFLLDVYGSDNTGGDDSVTTLHDINVGCPACIKSNYTPAAISETPDVTGYRIGGNYVL
jgi:hypothetical protein